MLRVGGALRRRFPDASTTRGTPRRPSRVVNGARRADIFVARVSARPCASGASRCASADPSPLPAVSRGLPPPRPPKPLKRARPPSWMPVGTRRRGRRSRTCTRAVARESATNATRDPRRRRLPSRDGAKRPRRAQRSSLRRHRLGHGCRLATRFHCLQNARPRSHDAAPAAIDSADLVEARADGLRGEMPSPKLWERQRHHAFARNNRPAAFEHGRAPKRVSCPPRDQGAHAAGLSTRLVLTY
jgi:hypothetical protein